MKLINLGLNHSDLKKELTYNIYMHCTNEIFVFMIPLQPVSIGTLPLPMQELAIVEDLLFLMMVRVVGSVWCIL